MYQKKDIAIGFLVSYVVADFLLSYSDNRPSLVWNALKNGLSNENTLMTLALAIGAGILAYFLAKKMKDF